MKNYIDLTQGTLSQVALVSLIGTLHTERQSGTLHVSSEGLSKRIHFKKGEIVFASSNAAEERLGELLIRNGTIRRCDFELVYEAIKKTHLRIGKALVDMGYLSTDEMQTRVIQQVETIIYSLFDWETGQYRSEPSDDPVDEDLLLNLSTPNIILEGGRRTLDPAAIRRGLGDPNAVVRLSVDPSLIYERIRLCPEEAFLLSRIDGSSNIAEILAISPLGEEASLRCLLGLVSAGFLVADIDVEGVPRAEPDGHSVSEQATNEKAPDPMRPRRCPDQGLRDEILRMNRIGNNVTHYELFDLMPTASFVQIKNAYLQMVERLHPDRARSQNVGDLDAELNDAFRRVARAYEVLSDPHERYRYDASLKIESTQITTESIAEVPRAQSSSPARSAEPLDTKSRRKAAAVRYEEGRRFFAVGQYYEAVQVLKDAVRLEPDRANYHKLLAKALSENPKWRRQAAEHFQRAIKLEPFDLESYLGLGLVFEASGMSSRARKYFEEVLTLDPDNKLAMMKLNGKQTELKGSRELFGLVQSR